MGHFHELFDLCKDYISIYKRIYKLNIFDDVEINNFYQEIKNKLIATKIQTPDIVLSNVNSAMENNNCYYKSYKTIIDMICNDYGVKFSPFIDIKDIQTMSADFKAILNAIINDDIEALKPFTETENFNGNILIKTKFYPLTENDGYTILELCCYHGSVNCFKLLRAKFDTEISETSFNFSFLGGNPEIIKECLKFQEPDAGCMEYAIISHNIDFVTYLMNEYELKIDLYNCIEFNNLEAYLVYLDQTNDVNSCFASTPLFGITELNQYLLSHGADINSTDSFGVSALYYAALHNRSDYVEFLVNHGANMNIQDTCGVTPLQLAILERHYKIATFLILHGADVNIQNIDGDTALHLAVRFKLKDIVELIVSHGADLNITNEKGETALQST
ncbi:hypothetical protein TVAG_071550 [Trichomonas vaginalis G3]|uniref:DUF3447 domain-containing protein n=1 Tax=Trichomonas vaginalis (strain ATCC PRA-98 / G3) TaxID=412133 RepID=A2D858_TRIV3|nr:proteasome regulatory particle assembly [Trichomonas vaginalis G3]EAY23491.1 hypothetical protein TVAG_071550 [Trichomonas vaginalis G3]KAI5493913.1 proteasome regulatory particle assembly [Trichomonas vaginalis G3]|eukprot:XP_001584477.1 hypothetical protein [Trichomonas vaginalis G3]